MTHFGECSMHTSYECVFWCSYVECIALISLFRPISICFSIFICLHINIYTFRWSYAGCINIYKCYIFLVDWAPFYYVIPISVFYYSFCFKVYFVWYKYSYPAFTLFPFAWDIFFHPFTFSLCFSLHLRWVLL